jgi:hypothetical protein
MASSDIQYEIEGGYLTVRGLLCPQEQSRAKEPIPPIPGLTGKVKLAGQD